MRVVPAPYGGPLFPVRAPLDPEDVVDREGFLDELVHRLLEVESVLVAGPRRTGKTVAVDEALRRLRQRHRAYVAEVDLFYCASARELASKLIAACLANRDGHLAQLAGSIERTLGGLLRHADFSAKFQGLELHWLAAAGEASDAELLDRALELPERLAERDGRLSVVFLDEFERVEQLGGEDLLRRMRAAFQRQRHTSHVFAGSRPSTLRALFAEPRRAFYRFATPLSLPAIPPEAWVAYATRKFAGRRLGLAPAAVERIIERTGGHPWGMVRVLSAAYHLAVQTQASDVDLDLAHAAHLRVLEDEADLFAVELDGLDDVPLARVVLERVARDEPVYGGRSGDAHPERVRRALRALVERCILRRTGRGRYAFEEPLLRQHLLDPRGLAR